MKQLVVNADDYGRTESGDRRIRKSVEGGIATSTSVMTNIQDDLDTEFFYGKDVGVGFHLNLTEGRPLTRAPSLVDRSGSFLGPKRFLARYLLGRLDSDDIRREAMAQLEKLEASYQGQLDHINSHHHVHLLPGIKNMVLEIADASGMPYVRCSREHVPSLKYLYRSLTYSRLPRFFAVALTRLFASCSRKCAFSGILNMGCWTRGKMKIFLEANSRQKTELVLHPERERDLQILLDPEVKDATVKEYELGQFSSFFEYRRSNSF